MRSDISVGARYEEGRALSRAQTSSTAEGTARIEQLAAPACEGRQDSSRSAVRQEARSILLHEPQTWETGLRYCKTPAGEPMVPITDTRCPNPQWRSGSGTGWSSRVRPSKTRQLRVDDLLELRFRLRAAQKCSVDEKAWRRVHSDGGARLHVLLYLGLVFA